jgi:tRNA(Ile)-lysidine synthase
MTPGGSEILAPWLDRLRRAPRLYVGFSGGLDSTFLLDALIATVPAARICAVHVNHGLSPHSDDWQARCEAFCHDRGIDCRARRVRVVAAGEGLESAARRARYAVFEQVLEAGDLLLLAHHLDDQVETVLYRLLRGSGPRGLAGMPAERGLGRGTLVRPLLHVERHRLETWAREKGLTWIEDEANRDFAFDRNFLRHRLLPVIESRWPDYRQRLARSAGLCARSDDLAGEVAGADLPALGERPEKLGWSLDLGAFRRLTVARRENLLRHWVRDRGLGGPGHGVIESVLDDLLPARDDARPVVAWRGGSFRRYQGRLYLLPPLDPVAFPDQVTWDARSPLTLPDGGRLTAEKVDGRGLRLADGTDLLIGFRRGGERCTPEGRPGSAPLKKLAQEYCLPPWLRERVPLIHVGGSLAAVGDSFVCAGFAAGPGETGLVFTWRYPHC